MGEAKQESPLYRRVLLLGEVVAYVAALVCYVLLRLPVKETRWYDVVFFVLAGTAPIAMNLFHGDRPVDSGLRVDNISESAKEVLPVTLVMLTGIVGVGLTVGGFHWRGWGHFASRAGMYVAWGPIQQYLLQSFALRRLRQSGLSAAAAVVLAAGLFAMVHAPNWPLVALAAGGGGLWCVLFLRHANIVTLGLAHAAVAILLYYAWPEEWLHRLTVGGEYLLRAGVP